MIVKTLSDIEHLVILYIALERLANKHISAIESISVREKLECEFQPIINETHNMIMSLLNKVSVTST